MKVGMFAFFTYDTVHIFIPPYDSVGGTLCLCQFLYGNGFLSRGFTDQREILPGGLATSRTCLLLLWGDIEEIGQSRVSVEFYNRVLSVLELMMIKKNILHAPFVF